jgi:hypothetical protein
MTSAIPNDNRYTETLRIRNFDTYVYAPQKIHEDVHDSHMI